MDTLIIPGPPGLSVADFAFETYLDGVQQADPGLSTSVLDTVDGVSHYLVSGRPAGEQGESWVLTWEMPGGYAGSHLWPVQFGTPAAVILPIRTPGVVIGDLSLRLYLDGVGVSTGGLSLSYLDPDYAITGLPTAALGSQYVLSWAWGGASGTVTWPTIVGALPATVPPGELAYEWTPSPGTALEPGGAGELVLAGPGGVGASIAVGTSPGLADLLYSTPSGSGPYSTGVLSFPAGGFVHALAVVEISGAATQVSRASWPVQIHSSGFDWFGEEVVSHIEQTWPLMGPWESRSGELSDPPPYLPPNAHWSPTPGQPYLDMSIIWTYREGFGAQPILHYRAEGFLQHDVYVPAGAGSHGLMLLSDRMEPMWREASIPGFSAYPAQPPRPVDAPDGWEAVQVDVPFRWEWSP